MILLRLHRKLPTRKMRSQKNNLLQGLKNKRILQVNSLRSQCGKPATLRIPAARLLTRANQSKKPKKKSQNSKKAQTNKNQRRTVKSGVNTRLMRKCRTGTKRLTNQSLRKNKTKFKKKRISRNLRKNKTDRRPLKTQRKFLTIAQIVSVWETVLLIKNQKKAKIPKKRMMKMMRMMRKILNQKLKKMLRKKVEICLKGSQTTSSRTLTWNCRLNKKHKTLRNKLAKKRQKEIQRRKDLMRQEIFSNTRMRKMRMSSHLPQKTKKACTRGGLSTRNQKVMLASPMLMSKNIDCDMRKVMWMRIFLTQKRNSTRVMGQQNNTPREELQRTSTKSANFTKGTRERKICVISTNIIKTPFSQSNLRVQRQKVCQNLQKVSTSLLLKRLNNLRWTDE